MSHLVTVHAILAGVLLLLALLIGFWGLLRTSAIASGSRVRESRTFAQVLQLSHTIVLATGIIGVLLLVEGQRPADPLHARVYGPFMVVAIVAAYGYRTRDAARNIRVFAVASFVIAALGLRALATAG